MTTIERERLDQLTWKMLDYYSGDAARIQHFTKVYTYVDWISRGENVEEETRCLLAVLGLTHDVGIKASIEKYGHYNAKLQEQEGPAVAEAMLSDLDFDPALIERVCQIIGRHHTYTGIDGVDCQILIEADFLVNFCEGHQPLTAIPNVYENIFRTETGKAILRKMYDYHPEG